MEKIAPMEIERRSFETITKELTVELDPKYAPIVKRVIHTTADFEYANTMTFSPNVVDIAIDALKNGCDIVTDTQMAKSGINKTILGSLGGTVHCFVGDEDVAAEAKERGVTRSIVAVEKAVRTINKPCIFVMGNAPTALIRIEEITHEQDYTPVAVVGVPVGFVNVVESKEQIIASGIPHIVARGRKGGSNVAASIINALLYTIKR